jgi:streptomycin 6-kinase
MLRSQGRLVNRAAGLLVELSESATDQVVLHGDLHHDNVLRAEREPWLAIDPHGVVGDPGFEVGAMLYNPDPARRDRELLALVPARIEQLADGLGCPRTGWRRAPSFRPCCPRSGRLRKSARQ